jgi:excinuclease ABC subunit C
MTDDALREKLDLVPVDPGVYLWKDEDGRIIYVGKAKVLRNRVRSYFQRTDEKDIKTRLLVARIADVDWIVTNSEKEALILEATLIKAHFPRYNVRLRDDKRFISLKLDLKHDFPRLYVVRQVKRDGNIYYGPFSDARAIRSTLRFINASFRLRKCSDVNFASRKRPCLQHQIGRCHAPCVGFIGRAPYSALVDEVRLFFSGRLPELAAGLKTQMEQKAAALDFEEAATLRDRIAAIEKSLEKQPVVSHGVRDIDAFGVYREGAAVVISQLFVRGGAITGQRVYPFGDIEDEDGQILRQLLGVYYSGETFLPRQILLPTEPDGGLDQLSEWFSEIGGQRIDVHVAQRGHGRKLVLLAKRNAKRHFEARRTSLVTAADVLADVQEKLNLERSPETIECFDISNVQGKLAVASMVRFAQAEPDKSGYRRYRIRTIDEPDDFAMMREALTRRLRRGATKGGLPDLLLVDGGKGQLGVAVAVLEELSLAHVPVAAITKIKDLAPGDMSAKDKVFLPGRKNAVTFRGGSHALHLLQRVRDEAHRFAIEYHRKLRSKNMTQSVLDAAPGLGGAKQKALLKTFGSLKKIREASVEQLQQAPGIGPKLAAVLFEYLHAE